MTANMSDIWYKTAVLGGDERQLSAARRLAVPGHEVAVWGLKGDRAAFGNAVRTVEWHDAIRNAGCVLLPLPITGDGVRIHTMDRDQPELRFTHLLDLILPEQRIFAGRIPPAFKAMAAERGIPLIDYSENELFQIKNAVPTAEGAIEIALGELPVTLFGTEIAILGHGRIGKVLLRLLLAMGANVTVAARKVIDLTWIAIAGGQPLLLENIDGVSSLSALRNCRVIFNTIPYWVLTETVFRTLRPDVLVIDLASAPGGADPKVASELGIRLIRAPGLPGKTAPETAGKIVAETVISLMTGESGAGK
jgi:dipicolinate synthase subunit A